MTATSLGPAYNRLWLATALSNLGDGIRMAALPLLATGLSAEPVAVAGVSVAGQAPWLLFGFFAGAVVDRFDRRRLTVLVDVTRVLLLLVLVAALALNVAGIALVYAVAFACGVGETLRDTATATLLPPLVSDADLDRANGGLVNAEVAGNELVGPPLGGYLFGVAMMLPFAVNGSIMALAAALIFSLPSVLALKSAPAGGKGQIWADTRAGLRWLMAHRRLRALVLLGGLFALLDSAWFSIFTLYVLQVLALPAWAYGGLLGVGAVGGLAGGYFAARVTRLVGSGTALTGCLGCAAAGQLMLGLTTSVPVAAVGLAITSAAFGVWAVAGRTLRQRLTPPELLGRVSSASMTIVMGAAPLGALAGGFVAAGWGLTAPILAGVPALTVGALACHLALREPH
ncbi:Predicted arabinose efflux permease, MFS family [Nonomuraea maritima]|uniref:Predicted arabinose efflux permease, MFS family n=1 Tax=Nonomuraea maritima TaxID=683260 RepID=A0A1G8SKG4_9ACTN|nr:MFS transporter [Nonomuraea maritima]SDJ29701.1 Predicted arabinose efflux permease, MFS family [Nonomuraea maritima]